MWQELYRHPRSGPEWCGEAEWRRRLEEVQQVVAAGRRVWAKVEPPEWDAFKAHVKRLPKGKGGVGNIRHARAQGPRKTALRVGMYSIRYLLQKMSVFKKHST